MNARPLFPRSAAVEFGHDPAHMLRRANEAALAIVEAGARASVESLLARRQREAAEDARIMARQPWRITRVVYGGFAPAVWPVPRKTAVDVLADCARLIRTQERQRDLDRWTYDPTWVEQLRIAEDALVAIVMDEAEPDPLEAA